jgi:hypothetical protein
MTRAGHRIEIRIGGLAKPGAIVDQATQAAAPLVLKRINVVGSELIDDEEDDEARFPIRRLGGRDGSRGRQRHEQSNGQGDAEGLRHLTLPP